jgi:hypothetical protein
MREYWDRFIRNDRHLENTVLYIHQNPVKAALCQRAEEWPWSSAGTPTSPSASTHSSANEDVGAPSPAASPKCARPPLNQVQNKFLQVYLEASFFLDASRKPLKTST